MKENQLIAVNTYVNGVLEYLSDYKWEYVIALWNMETNRGFFKIFDENNQEIRPQFYRDEKNLEQPKKNVPVQMREGDLLIKKSFEDLLVDIDSKWNLAEIKILRTGKFFADFKWDNNIILEHELKLSRASVTLLYERFYEILTFEILEEKKWETAIVTSRVKDKSIANTVEVITEGQKFNYDLILSERWEEYFLDFYEKTNIGILKDTWPNWNCMKIKMLYEDRLEIDKDVTFSVE